MQRIINYGSFLQAYALSNTIKNLGHEVEFVDFKIEPCVTEPVKPRDIKLLPEEYHKGFYFQKDFENTFKSEFLPNIGIDKRNERSELDTLVIR